MWGTSSHGDELTGNFANEFDAISIDDRGLFRLLAGKLLDGNLGLLQQNRPKADIRDTLQLGLLSLREGRGDCTQAFDKFLRQGG